MKFTLSNEKKKELAQQALDALEMHYYREIIFIGENPETFVLPNREEITDPNIVSSYANLISISEKINNINQILESLS